MGRGQSHRTRVPGLSRLEPPGRAHAPAVTGLESKESVFGSRGRQVVANCLGVGQELARHRRTHRVGTDVVLIGVAASVPEESGDRVLPTFGEFSTQAIARHVTIKAPTVAAMEIREATTADAEAIRQIYNFEVEHSTSTFDMVPRTLAEQEAYINDRSGAHGVLVAEINGAVVGFGALSSYRHRCAYNTTVENSIYVSESARGLGVGRGLLTALVDLGKERGFHTIVAYISGAEGPSVALHRSCGFRVVGTQREVGRKFGQWLDVTVMQIMLAEA